MKVPNLDSSPPLFFSSRQRIEKYEIYLTRLSPDYISSLLSSALSNPVRCCKPSLILLYNSMSVWTFIYNINIWEVFDVPLLYIYAEREAGGPGRSKLIKHSNIDHLDPNMQGKYLLPTLGGVKRRKRPSNTPVDLDPP